VVGTVKRAVRLVLVEDNAVYRSSLELLLAMQPDLDVVGVAATATDALAVVGEHSPDVVLLDFRLPDMDGDAAVLALRANHPGAAVICLTAEASPEEWNAVLAAGAVGMIEKGVSIDELASAVRAAAGARE
jgi:DNA-binding NarL/FixJ family response regulator